MPRRAHPESSEGRPWRALLAQVREAVGTHRDARGTVGSIDWLRAEMAARGANPNVVRNIVYRDKGRASDKRVLFAILDDLWTATGRPPLEAPAGRLLDPTPAESEEGLLQGLGREKRRAFRRFVGGVQSGEYPSVLLTGRPGSGKTLVLDAVEQALRAAPPEGREQARLEASNGDLDAALTRLARTLGAPREALRTRLARIGDAGSFAVQADAQAAVARLLVDAAQRRQPPLILLVHVSRTIPDAATLGSEPLRLPTPEVPRVDVATWAWHVLLAPLAALPGLSLLVSMAEPPDTAREGRDPFDATIKLSPPGAAEARRFVKARLPALPPGRRDALVREAGRSFEALRALTLLTQLREAPEAPAEGADREAATLRLAALATDSGDSALRAFLEALSTLAHEDAPTFAWSELEALRGGASDAPDAVERAFLDPVPGAPGHYRPFSRQFARALRDRLREARPERHRALHRRAAGALQESARGDPSSDTGARYVHHLLEGDAWAELSTWMRAHGVRQAQLLRIWTRARERFEGRRTESLEAIAREVAAQYVALGSYGHRHAEEAFAVLGRASDPAHRAWSALKQAEGEVQRGHHEAAERWLRREPLPADPLLAAEAALVHASVARWRGHLDDAARHVDEGARPRLARLGGAEPAERLAQARAAVWSGLIHKDRGDLEAALAAFDSMAPRDGLVRARLAFQRGDVTLRLGRLGASRDALDEAVALADRHDAIASERTRYLGRRATVKRRLGDVPGARFDLEAGREALRAFTGDADDRAFWEARLDEETALLEGAMGHARRAVETLLRVLDTYHGYARRRGVDLRYRLDRLRLRLAAGYVVRAATPVWRQPLPLEPQASFDEIDADGRHARRLLAAYLRSDAGPGVPWAVRELVRHAWLLHARVAPAPEARRAAARALARAAFDHGRAEAQVHAAAAALADGDAAATMEATDAGLATLAASGDAVNDPALRAWAHALRADAACRLDDRAEAFVSLRRILEDAPSDAVRIEALRRVGAAMERAGRAAYLRHPDLPGGPVDAGATPWLRPAEGVLTLRAARPGAEPAS